MPLLDLSQIKIRAPIQAFSTPNVPTKLFDYEPDRLVVIFYLDFGAPGYLTPGRSYNAVRPMGSDASGYTVPLEIYGPEEIWLTGTISNTFATTSGFWQAIYRA